MVEGIERFICTKNVKHERKKMTKKFELTFFEMSSLTYMYILFYCIDG